MTIYTQNIYPPIIIRDEVRCIEVDKSIFCEQQDFEFPQILAIMMLICLLVTFIPAFMSDTFDCLVERVMFGLLGGICLSLLISFVYALFTAAFNL